MKKNDISNFQIHLWIVISNMNREYAKLNSHAHMCGYILDTKYISNSKQLILLDLRLSFQSCGQQNRFMVFFHDDVIKWKHFPRYWPFVRGIHRSGAR